MPVIGRGSPEALRINAAVSAWRQGDVALKERWFLHAAMPRVPLTAEADTGGDDELAAITSEVPGLVVVSQACDIARECGERPFVEVSPLVEIEDPGAMAQIRRLMRPRYLLVPTLESRALVADLDRTMTVEKGVVAGWERTEGCLTDQQRTDFANGLARKRSRAALPDDFVRLLDKLKKRIKDRVGKDSDEGKALRAIEIRAAGRPDWDSKAIDLSLLFIVHEDGCDVDPGSRDVIVQKLVDEWAGLVKVGGRFRSVAAVATTMDRMSAADYMGSDLLDLDYLSP